MIFACSVLPASIFLLAATILIPKVDDDASDTFERFHLGASAFEVPDQFSQSHSSVFRDETRIFGVATAVATENIGILVNFLPIMVSHDIVLFFTKGNTADY